MNTLCGIGLPELIIVALLGFVLIGPERSKDVAVRAGRFLRQVMTSEWWHEFSQVSRAVQDLPKTLMRMAEIEETQAELRQAMTEIETGTRVGLDEPLLKKPIPMNPSTSPVASASTGTTPVETTPTETVPPETASSASMPGAGAVASDTSQSQGVGIDSEGEAIDV